MQLLKRVLSEKSDGIARMVVAFAKTRPTKVVADTTWAVIEFQVKLHSYCTETCIPC